MAPLRSWELIWDQGSVIERQWLFIGLMQSTSHEIAWAFLLNSMYRVWAGMPEYDWIHFQSRSVAHPDPFQIQMHLQYRSVSNPDPVPSHNLAIPWKILLLKEAGIPTHTRYIELRRKARAKGIAAFQSPYPALKSDSKIEEEPFRGLQSFGFLILHPNTILEKTETSHYIVQGSPYDPTDQFRDHRFFL